MAATKKTTAKTHPGTPASSNALDNVWRCGCGHVAEGFNAINGHKGRRTHPDCALAPTHITNREEAQQLLADRDRAAAERDKEPKAPAGGGGKGDAPPTMGLAQGSPGPYGTPAPPPMVSFTVNLPAMVVAYYDASRDQLGFEGGFDQWISELVVAYFGLIGFDGIRLVRKQTMVLEQAS